LAQYGYGALFAVLFAQSFGLPFPGETFLVASSFLASQGQMRIVWVAAVAIVAAMLGDNVGYGIGRWGGQRLTMRYGARIGITPERLAKTARLFARFGPEIVIVARFIPVLRQLNGVVAGGAQMPWKRFLVYNALGATLWVGTWTAAVFLMGQRVEVWVSRIHDLALAVAGGVGVLAVAGGGMLLVRGIRNRQPRHVA
jgi:membrane protein DedA with SNARE-associated domain